ncbi:hypothetical protein SUGI_0437660 [Cryptomeria japonica]|nr:hypothetical protein SUGI_0437660 [Cryptomeria japonica]
MRRNLYGQLSWINVDCSSQKRSSARLISISVPREDGRRYEQVAYRRIGEMFDKNKDYKKARVRDPDVKNFHHTLAEEMGGVIKTLENARAEDGLPLTFFEVLISCLAKLDGHLKDLRLKNEEDIQKNPKLKEDIQKKDIG